MAADQTKPGDVVAETENLPKLHRPNSDPGDPD